MSVRNRSVADLVRSSNVLLIFKCPARDACLYMGEATPPHMADLPDLHFLFAIALQP